MLAVSLILLCMCLSQMLVTGQDVICWICHGTTYPKDKDVEQCLVPKYGQTDVSTNCYFCSEKREQVEVGGNQYCEIENLSLYY
jgi:hypothetical protein